MTTSPRVGLTGYGAYVPRLRLQRAAAVEAAGWLVAGLKGVGKGERALANWDEDAVTLAVEAARDCLGPGEPSVDDLAFASTSAPYAERLNAAIVAAALRLPREVRAEDAGSTLRAGVSALGSALSRTRAGDCKDGLVVAAEVRRARPLSPAGMRQGDAAASLRVGSEGVIAEWLGGHTETVDFIDRWRGANAEFDQSWEDRWIREEGWAKLVPPLIAGALSKAGVEAAAVDHVIFPCPYRGMLPGMLAKQGFRENVYADHADATIGDCGTAHPLLILASVLERAKPGEVILVGAFGQGGETLMFRTTAALERFRAQIGPARWLSLGQAETRYMKYLVFRDLIDWDKGPRGEEDSPMRPSTLYRNRDFVSGLVGWHCAETREALFGQAPEFKIAHSNRTFVRRSFADSAARIVTWSADNLAFSPDPPAYYGLVSFEEGGRLTLDFTDVSPGGVETGASMRMVFRIKQVDSRRGSRRYFWKAAPAIPTAPRLGADV